MIDTHLSQATSLHHDQQAEYEVRILQANKLEKRSDPLEKRRETLQKQLGKAEKEEKIQRDEQRLGSNCK